MGKQKIAEIYNKDGSKATLYDDDTISYPEEYDTGDSGDGDESDTDGIRPGIERLPNGLRTDDERRTNDNRTIVKPKSNQLDAANRKLLLREAETPMHFVARYAPIIEMLMNKAFVKSVIGDEKMDFFSVPKPLRLAINESLGIDVTRHTMDKCWYSLSYVRESNRKKKWRNLAVSLILLIAACITGVYQYYSWKHKAAPRAKIVSAEYTPEQREKDSLYIESWAIKERFSFFGFRYSLMLSDSNFVYGNDNERISIMKQHKKAQTDATKK